MKNKCKIVLDYKSKQIIENILKSIEVDNYNFVQTKIEDNKLIAEIESISVSSLIHTLDDFLACVSVAEKIVDKS